MDLFYLNQEFFGQLISRLESRIQYQIYQSQILTRYYHLSHHTQLYPLKVKNPIHGYLRILNLFCLNPNQLLLDPNQIYCGNFL